MDVINLGKAPDFSFIEPINKMISANCLFHFTNSLQTIGSIIINGFYPRYSLENWKSILKTESLNWAFPMVCFCDIPLTQAKKHAGIYGRYAIGLKKDWGIHNRINPVFYTYKNSSSSNHLIDAFNILRSWNSELKLGESSNHDELFSHIYRIMQFLKPYKGYIWRNERYGRKIVNFYDEREWRFIPQINNEPNSPVGGMSESIFHNKTYRNNENNKLESYRLLFAPSDIKHIVVSNDREKKQLINMLRCTYYKSKGEEVFFQLITKINSMQEITEDF